MLAYLDANTGSIVVAALAGGVAGIAVLVKLYWNRILGLFSKSHKDKAADLQDQLVTADESAHEDTPA